MTTAVSRPALSRALTSVFVVFAASGMSFSAIASRLPDVKRLLDLTPGELGTVLLAAALGAVVGLPSAGRLISTLGTKRTVLGGAITSSLGLLIASSAVDLVQVRPLVYAGMFIAGLGMGVWDVAMNHEGAAVERELGRAIMPWFHAAFSGATVVAALLGSLLTWAGVPVWLHIVGTIVLVQSMVWWVARWFFPGESLDETGDGSEPRGRSAWTEPRTLLIGVVVLAAAFTEGTANDWIAVAMTDGHDLPAWMGVLGFATFLGFMTLGRILGTAALDRYGRVPVLRILFGIAIVGSLLVVFGNAWMAFLGAALWGIGASLGFPVGMSAASDDPARASARLSVVSTIGYLAFLGGPPLLGYLGDHVGVLLALLAVAALLVPAFLAVSTVAPPQGNDER